MRRLLRRLDSHWFAPASLRDLALVRIFLVGVQLFAFTPLLDVQLRYAALSDQVWSPLPVLKIMMLPFGGWGVRPEPMLIEAVYLVCLVSGVCALVGFSTRFSLLCFAASVTFLFAHGYSYGEVHHPKTLLVIALWALALGPPHTRMSVDALLFRMRARRAGWQPPDHLATESELARWPLRVTQWCIALAYLSAAASKLEFGGLAWLNGYTLEYHVMRDVLVYDPVLGQEFAALPTFILAAISIGTVAFEFCFFLAILYPRLIWPFVLCGVAMHMGIYLTQDAPRFFQLMCTYIVFIESLRMTWPSSWTLRAHNSSAKKEAA